VFLFVWFQCQELVVSMLPSDELLAAVTRDMMLEFDQSRFTCITTSTKKNDPFWTHFFEYVVNQESNLTTQTFPKCLILGGPDGIDDLHTTLSAVRASGVKIIIIHAEPSEIWWHLSFCAWTMTVVKLQKWTESHVVCGRWWRCTVYVCQHYSRRHRNADKKSD